MGAAEKNDGEKIRSNEFSPPTRPAGPVAERGQVRAMCDRPLFQVRESWVDGVFPREDRLEWHPSALNA
jgi:hypothetical protein